MKKIGIVVDGAAESQALKLLTQRINIKDTQLLKPRYTDIQPKATPRQIARKAMNTISILLAEGAVKVVVLMDREDNAKCATELAKEIEEAFTALGGTNISVVIKNRKFENWLIADIDALRKLPNKFAITEGFRKRVAPDKADNVADAEAALKSISKTNSYQKGRDDRLITEKQDEAKIACNSRSFRRFLYHLGHEKYEEQSKKPHTDCKAA